MLFILPQSKKQHNFSHLIISTKNHIVFSTAITITEEKKMKPYVANKIGNLYPEGN